MLRPTESGGPGVDAIGMCLTGGLLIPLMLDPALLAPVICQPGLPSPPRGTRRADLGVSAGDLAAAARARAEREIDVLGYRFEGDKQSPPERFETLRRSFGEGFRGCELPGSGHSVFTFDYSDQDERMREALASVLDFLAERLKSES